MTAVPAVLPSGAGALPDGYVAAWQRESIAIGDAAPAEPQRVWWLQTPVAFADLRLALDADAEVQSFCGPTELLPGPRLTWHRELDLRTPAGADSGTVAWEGDALIEEGVATVFGAPTRYREVWRRLPDTDRTCLALRRTGPDGRIVVVGRYAITTVAAGPDSAHAAAAWELVDGTWTLRDHWAPDGVVPAAPPPAPGDLAVGDTVLLDDGAGWLVDGAWSP